MRLNYIANALGLILTDVGYFAFVPILVALCYQEWDCVVSFLVAGIFALFFGAFLRKFDKNSYNNDELNDIKRTEALTVVSLAWIMFGLIGAIPFLFYGFNFIDSLFESVSGITTTGATILTSFDIPKTLLFWRSFMQWLGGMGIIVLFVAILPQFAVAGRQMFYAEAPGPTEEKFTPRIKNTASAIWIVYTTLTFLCIVCLWATGMPMFDCICNAMSTLSAGGFSPNPESIGGYHSNAVVYIIMFFMFIAGTSFVMQSRVLTKRDPRLFWKSEEFRFYTKVVVVVSTILALFLYIIHNYSCVEAFRASFYQVLSIATTTGSSSENYHLWGLDCKLILFLSMFLSSCSGSAGGGVKMTRWLLIYKYIKNEMYKILHPNAVISIKIDNIVVSNQVIKQTIFFMLCYFLIFGLTAFLITIVEKNLVIGTSAAIASLGDIGPAFGSVIGPWGNYSSLTVFTKVIFILNMFIGRLEIIPFLVLFQKETWAKR